MSRTIDEKVVSMQFDNAQFEKNVRTSMSTLDRLKQSLNLNGAAKGLENVNSAARGIDMSPLANGVEMVRSKFSALEVMAITTLANITNSAVNAGKRIAYAFTLEPIKTGFQEYETQINAVQTILSNTRSKGTTLDQVNDALDELNHYADMTIYNFTEMTRNIGTFTAAGVDLDTSVSAIKGIANLAAVSGSTSQQASTAMYQLSQALAAGTVKLQDWNSVVNAGMGGQVFQDALKETARVHGIAIDDMIKSEGSFRETLQKGWLTSEILTETLAKFTGDLTEEQLKSMGYTEEQAKEIVALGKDANDAATKVKTFTQLMDTLKEAAQSGWTQTWEYIVGDFEDAKKLWTTVSDTLSEMINNSAEARNKVVGEWAEKGGRAAGIEAIKNAFEGLMNIIKPIKEAFREIFPPVTSEQLIKITEKVRDLTASFKEWTGREAGKIKSTFKGLFAVLDIFATVITKVAGGAVKLLGSLLSLGSGMVNVTGSIGDWLSGLRDSIKETNIFGKAVDALVGFLQKAIGGIKSFFSAIGQKIDSSGLDGFLNVLKNIWDFLGKIGGKIGSAFGDFFRSGDLETGLHVLNSGLIASILIGFKKFLSGGSLDKVKDLLDGLMKPLENLKDKVKPAVSMLDELKGCLEAYQNDLRANTLIKLAAAIAILAAAIFVLSTIDPGKLGSALTGMAVLFIELVVAMAALDKFAGGYKNSAKAIGIMIGMSVSILILASALKNLSSLSWEELGKGLTGVLGLMAILVGTMKVMSTNGKGFRKGASQMILMAAALKILASVCKDLSALSWEGLGKGVAGIAGILAVFVGFQKLMSLIKPEKMVRSALSLVIIGAAMKIFADVCQKFGSIKWGAIAKAGAAMGGMLALAAGFALLAGMSKKMFSSSVALVIIGASMEIFADVCQKFGSMQWESLGKAGAAVGGLLLLAAGFTLLSGLSKKMAGSVISLTIIAVAMEIFADVCQKFGSMEWESLAKAGVAVAGILALAVGFSLLAGLSTGMITASAGLLVMAAALAILTPVLTTLGGMSWGGIAKGLVAIAGAFTIIGLAGIILAPVVPAILALAGAVALLGVAALAFGAGVVLLGAGITSLAVALAAGVTAIVDGVLVILEGLGKALVLIFQAIVEAAPMIGQAIAAVIVAVIDTLVTVIPALAEGLMKIVVGLLDALSEYAPQIVQYLFKFVIGILDALGEMVPQFVQAAVNFLGKVFSGIVDALGSIDTEVLVNAILGVGLLASFLIAMNALAGLVPGAMAGLLGVGALVVELGLILAAIGALAQIPGLEWLISEGGNFLEKIGTAIGQFIGGIIGGVAQGVTSSFPEIANNLSAFMTNIQPFIDGARSIDPSVIDGVKALSQAILAITGADLLNSIASFITGEGSLEQFSEQLVVFGKNMKLYGDAVSGIDTASIQASAEAGKALSEVAKNVPRTDGWAQTILGSKDIGSFGSKLVLFGMGLKAYALSIAGVDAEAVKNSAVAGKALTELTESLPKSDGWAQTIFGSKDIDSFGSKLVSFGTSMKSYSNAVAGIDGAALSSSTNAFKSLSKLAKDTAGVDYDGLDDFGKNLEKFASSIQSLDAGKMQSASTAIKSIVDLSKTIAGANFSSFETLGKSLKSMVNDISSLNTSGLNSIVKSLSNLANSSMDAFVNGINSSGGRVAEAGRGIAANLAKGISSGTASINAPVDSVIRSMISRISASQSAFGNAGKVIILKFATVMKSGSSSVKTVFSSVLESAVSSARSYYTSFYNAGKYVADGFADGISANSYKAEAKAKAMAKAAEEAAKKQLKEHSPSKAFFKIGRFVSEGFAHGIDDASWMGKDSAASMAKEAMKGTGNAISRIAAMVSDGIDDQPTIRPVLDLSNISSGASRLNGMLDVNPSVGLLSNVRSVNSMMNRNQNGASNDDVISAIRDLGIKLGGVSGDTYAINGITYDDGTNVSEAVKTLVRATRLERRT